MKKMVMILISLVVLLCGLYFFMRPPSYVIEVKNVAAYETVMASDVAYLYFGRDTCKYCRKFEPLMNNAIEETGTDVHKYDTDTHKNDQNFQDIIAENEVETVPKLIRLEKGIITDFVDHTHSQEEITAFLNGK